MEPGHPYLTEDFDERRSDHRSAGQVLAEWDRRVAAADPNRQGPWTFDPRLVPPPSDALLAEVACRQVIDRQLSSHRAWLEEERSYQSAMTVGQTLRAANDEPWTTISARLDDPDEPATPAEFREFSKEIHTLLGLLTLADHFAWLAEHGS